MTGGLLVKLTAVLAWVRVPLQFNVGTVGAGQQCLHLGLTGQLNLNPELV